MNKKEEIQEKEDWQNEHGDPDFEFLRSLATANNPEALEKLKSIAEDLNVEYDADTSPVELVERIGPPLMRAKTKVPKTRRDQANKWNQKAPFRGFLIFDRILNLRRGYEKSVDILAGGVAGFMIACQK